MFITTEQPHRTLKDKANSDYQDFYPIQEAP